MAYSHRPSRLRMKALPSEGIAVSRTDSFSNELSSQGTNTFFKYTAKPKTTDEIIPLLYEGNYNEWLKLIEIHLKEHDLWAHVGSLGSLTNVDVQHWTCDPKAAVQEVLVFVHGSIVSRLTEDDLSNVRQLWSVLRKLASTFRLLDLPAELRDRVFELAVVSEEPIRVVEAKHASGNERGYFKAQSPPALIQASRQTRHEALPVYYGKNSFVLILNCNRKPFKTYLTGHHDQDRWDVNHLWKWAAAIGRDAIRHLRDLTIERQILQLNHHYVALEWVMSRFRVQYSKGAQFRAEIPRELTIANRNWLLLHVEEVERHRRMHQLQGEALVNYFVCNLVIWDEPRREMGRWAARPVDFFLIKGGENAGPPETVWEEASTPDGRCYYWDTHTYAVRWNAVRWKEPAPHTKLYPSIDESWETTEDIRGRTYYYNTQTGDTTWEKPRALVKMQEWPRIYEQLKATEPAELGACMCWTLLSTCGGMLRSTCAPADLSNTEHNHVR